MNAAPSRFVASATRNLVNLWKPINPRSSYHSWLVYPATDWHDVAVRPTPQQTPPLVQHTRCGVRANQIFLLLAWVVIAGSRCRRFVIVRPCGRSPFRFRASTAATTTAALPWLPVRVSLLSRYSLDPPQGTPVTHPRLFFPSTSSASLALTIRQLTAAIPKVKARNKKKKRRKIQWTGLG